MLVFLYTFLLGGLALAIGNGGSEDSGPVSAGAAPEPDPFIPDEGDGGDEDDGGTVGGDDAPDSPVGGGDGGGSGGGTVGDGSGSGGGDIGGGTTAPTLPASAYDIGWAGLSDEEQLIVELVNRARLDPLDEVARLSEGLASGITSTSKQALAVDPNLSASARGHSEDMDNRDFFDHINPDGDGPGQRAIDDGYGSGFVGENIGWIGSSRAPDEQLRAEAHHENLWESDGHQRNLMNDNWSEVGLGYDYGDYRGLDHSTFTTEVFGDKGITYLTGVVIDDTDGDDFYDIGEGQGGVRVTAYTDDEAYATATYDAGGYSLQLPPGTYRVVFEGGELDAPYETEVTIGDENVKLDVIEDDGTVLASLNAGTPMPGIPVIESARVAESDDGDDEIGIFGMV